MSIYVIQPLFAIPMKPLDKLVAITLANHAHDDGTSAYPALETIARQTGLSVSSVRRSIKSLLDAGHIVREKRSHQHYSNQYAFVLPEGMASFRPSTETSLGRNPRRQGVHSAPQSVQMSPPECSQRTPNTEEPSYEKNASQHLDDIGNTWPALAAHRVAKMSVSESLAKRNRS